MTHAINDSAEQQQQPHKQPGMLCMRVLVTAVANCCGFGDMATYILRSMLLYVATFALTKCRCDFDG